MTRLYSLVMRALGYLALSDTAHLIASVVAQVCRMGWPQAKHSPSPAPHCDAVQ